MVILGLLAASRGLDGVDSDTSRSRMGEELAVLGRLCVVRSEAGVSCVSGGTKSWSKSRGSLGENITPVVAANGSVPIRDLWCGNFRSGGVLGSMESSSVMVTADTAFENGLDVSGP